MSQPLNIDPSSASLLVRREGKTLEYVLETIDQAVVDYVAEYGHILIGGKYLALHRAVLVTQLREKSWVR